MRLTDRSAFTLPAWFFSAVCSVGMIMAMVTGHVTRALVWLVLLRMETS